METIQTLRRLHGYNEWANRRMLEAFEESTNRSSQALRAWTHLLVAEKAWMARLRQPVDSAGFNFWPDHSWEACAALVEENRKAYAALLRRLSEDDLDATATYKNSKGIEYRTSLRDILTHVFLHSTYHRGQVTLAVRAAGGTPANTDYIAFVREQEARERA